MYFWCPRMLLSAGTESCMDTLFTAHDTSCVFKSVSWFWEGGREGAIRVFLEERGL